MTLGTISNEYFVTIPYLWLYYPMKQTGQLLLPGSSSIMILYRFTFGITVDSSALQLRISFQYDAFVPAQVDQRIAEGDAVPDPSAVDQHAVAVIVRMD